MQIGGLHLVFGAALMFAVAFAVAVIVIRFGFYHSAVQAEVCSNRYHAIDGLRGYLALGVLVHHVCINRQFYETGTWALTPSRLNTFMGSASVAFFFMITAFLFWGRVIESGDRFDTLRFYGSRIRRLVPMYLVSAGCLIVTVLALTHFRLEVPIRDLVEQVASWLLFTIPGYPAINGFKSTILINTVFWSLVYEWKFYLVLPFIATLAAGGRAWIVAVGVGLCVALFSASQIEWLFVGGCIAAYVVRVESVRTWLTGPAASAAALADIAATALFHPLAYNTLGAVLLFFPFLVFAAGNSLFGALTCRPARVLGLLSYSIYLLHNWVLYLVSRLVNHFTPIANLSPGLYWMLGLVVALFTVSLSAFTYRFVEFPGMRRGETRNARSDERERTSS